MSFLCFPARVSVTNIFPKTQILLIQLENVK